MPYRGDAGRRREHGDDAAPATAAPRRSRRPSKSANATQQREIPARSAKARPYDSGIGRKVTEVKETRPCARPAVTPCPEEMRTRVPSVFLMGEESGRVSGGLKIQVRAAWDEFGPSVVIDTPIHRNGFARYRVGALFRGFCAQLVRVHDL